MLEVAHAIKEFIRDNCTVAMDEVATVNGEPALYQDWAPQRTMPYIVVLDQPHSGAYDYMTQGAIDVSVFDHGPAPERVYRMARDIVRLCNRAYIDATLDGDAVMVRAYLQDWGSVHGQGEDVAQYTASFTVRYWSQFMV